VSEKDWFGGKGAGDALEIVSLRDPSVGDSTAAYVMVDDEFFCHSIEDPVREPATGRPSGDFAELERWVRSWKIPGETAIASGRVQVTIDESARFKKRMLHLLRTPGFDGVRAHSGLTPKHSEGCILLGDELYKVPAGWRVKDGQSRPAVDRMFALVEEALERKLEVWWTFKPNPNSMRAAA
jgi:hypothetical protein